MHSQVWEQWGAMVLAARPVVGSLEEARDCAAEAMVQYLERQPADVVNLEAFMVTIAKRRALDHVRARDRARVRDSRIALEQGLSAPDVAEDVAARAEAFWVDAEARRILQPRVYELLRLVAEGVPTPELARRFDLSERAVQSHLLRARRLVRAALVKTLAALGLGAAALRRWPGTAAAAAPALALAFALGMATLGPLASPAQPALALMPGTTVVTDEQRGSARSGQPGARHEARRQDVAANRDAAARSGPTTLVDVQTPVVGVETQRRDDGQQSSGPVEQLQQCLENLRIELHYQGCEQQSPQQQPGHPGGDGPALPASRG